MLWREIPDRQLTSRLMDEPRAFLDHLDGAGVERACLINYVSPEVMGFTEDVNRFVGEFAKEDRKRLIPFGSVHPKRTKDPKRDVERLASKWEMGGMKIHPPHQLFAANAYADGTLPALRTIYKTAERLKMPVMVHTGTSVFPGARSKFGDPMALDDVAQDFPDLTILMAHGGRPLWCDTAFYLLRRHRNLHLDIEHPAEAPSRVVPSTRRNLGQSRLRVGLAGAGCARDPRGDRRTSVPRAVRADEGTDPERERRGPCQVTDVKSSP